MTTHHTEGIAQNTYSPYWLELLLLNVVVRVNCNITVVGAASYRIYKKSKKAAEILERGLPSISSYARNHFHRKIGDRCQDIFFVKLAYKCSYKAELQNSLEDGDATGIRLTDFTRRFL